MKRDMDLLRRMLIALEALDGDGLGELDGVDPAHFAEHAQLLVEAGLVEAQIVRSNRVPADAYLTRITFAGHDFVDAAKNDGLWAKVKSKVITSGSAFTFDLIKELLKAEVAKGFPSLS